MSFENPANPNASHSSSIIPIAELLIESGWAVAGAGTDGLTASRAFWESIDRAIRELAASGHFLKRKIFARYLKDGPVEGDPAAWFDLRAYRIRSATLADVEALLALEQACWIEPLRAAQKQLEHRVTDYPDGQFVAELNGEIAGAIYSQRIDDPAMLYRTDFRKVSALHRADGPIAQALAVNVLPLAQQCGLGDRLLEFLLQMATLQPDIERAVGVTLCRRIGGSSVPIEDYIHLRNRYGQPVDPILHFHVSHGARICGIIDGYRPADLENEGKGVLVEYDFHTRLSSRAEAVEPDKPLDRVIEEAIRAVMGQERAAAFSLKRPLEEMGFDSLRLLQLCSVLNQELGSEIDPTFFFRYNTVPAMIDYFQHGHAAEPRKLNPALGISGASITSPGRPLTQTDEFIAIVGMACRFPGSVASPEEFWSLLANGVDAIAEAPPDRSIDEGYYSNQPGHRQKSYGGFLDRVADFDAAFFRIAPVEAKAMDPQQRLLLETHWEALERAGIDPETLKGSSTGIYTGIFGDDYKLLQAKQPELSAYFGTGTSNAMAAGRIAYFLGTEGPALCVDTACSSSLVAVHLACQALQRGDANLALASGVNLILTPELSAAFLQANMLAADGRCKTFDAAADGYVRSEGCGVLVLKRLSDAEAASDNILAVIRGTAINQDGASNGLTAPNGLAQEAMIRKALLVARLQPADISYVEAHGTGTPLGDPIEVGALEAAYNVNREANDSLVVGSVKTNIGHTEAAAGIAGLMKVVLALQNCYLPPHLHFKRINPHLAGSSIIVPSTGLAWERSISGKPRRAAVSSFGFSGTNAHAILEEAPELPKREESDGDAAISEHLFTLSAKNDEALSAMAAVYQDFLRNDPAIGVAALCYSQQTGRAHFERRLSIPAQSILDIQTKLDAYQANAAGLQQGPPKIGFLFTGQGSQYLQMGRELYETQPLFRQRIDRCDQVLQDCLGRSLIELLYPAEPPLHRDLLDSHPCGQAANFALECALADLWRSWGVQPDVVLGHSLGDFAAAYTAGVISLEEGLRLVVERGRLMETALGGMVSVRASEAEVEPFLAGFEDVVIGAINGPRSVVISGGHAGVALVTAQLEAKGYETRKLDIPVAAHSPMLDPVLARFEKAVRELDLKAPVVPVVSSMTGRLVSGELIDPAYWRRHLRSTVRFADGVRTLLERGCTILIEIGPKATLLGMAGEILDRAANRDAAIMLPSLPMLTSLGELYVRGVDIDWAEFHRHYPRRKILLPTYPFQRQRYWIESGATKRQPVRETASEIEALFHKVAWKLQDKPSAGLKPKLPGHWLILTDDTGSGPALATRLRTLGETATVAGCGIGQTALIEHLTMQPEDLKLRGVVLLCAVATLPDAEPLVAANGLAQVLQIVQTLAGRAEPAHLWVVTQGAQQLATSERMAPAQTALWGLGRAIALEHNELWGGLVDLDPDAAASAQSDSILSELLRQPDAELEVAYRKAHRYVARLVRGGLNTEGEKVAIQPNATYLVTGGLGGLGLIAAEWLAEQGARNLILTGRRGFTNPHQQSSVDRLLATGVQVQVAAIDVTDEPGMRDLFMKIAGGDKPLKGIIHTAGVLDNGIVLNQSWDRFAAVLAPKITGGWLLHRLTHELPLDFMVFYSSVTSVVGNPGHGAYAAANAFLDGLACYRKQRGLRGMSVNWGIWPEAGILQRIAKVQYDGVQPLAPGAGKRALGYLIAHQSDGLSQIAVASYDWSAVPENPFQPFLSNFVAPPQVRNQAATRITFLQNLQSVPTPRRLEYLREHLQKITGRLLGMPDLPERTTGFFDLGMDSLIALKLRRHLEDDLAQRLPATVVFEHPSIETLSNHLLNDVLRWTESQDIVSPKQESQLKAVRESDAAAEPIAVIGMACRFPGAATPEEFWTLLQSGVDAVCEIPASRWNTDRYYDPRRPAAGKMYVREAGFVDGVENFDPLFFGIAPREARSMDPQQWLLLEAAWEALERAGLPQSKLVESQTGVFVGVGAMNYGSLNDGADLAALDKHAITSGGHHVAAGRLSYALGLQGPAVAVDTACSSSLVALHLACQSLRAGECDLAFAGGVNLMLSPSMHVALCQMEVLAADGRCKAFDADADGFGRGEGCGVVLLKRLRDAEADGDTILALVKGSAVNHDGPGSGLTVPNKRAQEKMLRLALANACVCPSDVGYIEAHGTGTQLGDPIEIRALGGVFGAGRQQPLLVGTVKSNIGHLEAAAGIAGVIKTILAMRHGQVPAQLHFHVPNPYIEWEEFSVAIPKTNRPWPRGENSHDLVAGVSSFGISGTNAHVILASAPQPATSPAGKYEEKPERPLHLLLLSAKNEAALSDLVARYLNHLETHPDLALGDLCHTAAIGRNHFNRRLAITVEDRSSLQLTLSAIQQQDVSVAGTVSGFTNQRAPTIAFLFSGQGSQYAGMGSELYETQPTFRTAVDSCDELLRALIGRSIWKVMGSKDTDRDHPSEIDDTTYAQPALFVLEYALARLWQSWGVTPDILIGHSVGEIVAACIAGVFTLEDGLKLVAARGRSMGALPREGEMVSARISEDLARRAIGPYASDLSIAAVNGPGSTVISGRSNAVAAVTKQLAEEGVELRKLAVSHAFHSPSMTPMLAAFSEVAKTIAYHPPRIPIVSNVTGKLAGNTINCWQYWVRHVLEPVRFADGIAALREQGADIFLEIGPKPVLVGMARQCVEAQGSGVTPADLFLPSLREGQSDWRQMLESLGMLYVRGVSIDWLGFDQDYHRRKVPAPTYPFQRQRYWDRKPAPHRPVSLRPLIDKMTRVRLQNQTIFDTEFSLDRMPWLSDHRVYGAVVSPGACQLALALSAAEMTIGKDRSLCLEDTVLPQALVIPEAGARNVQTVLGPVPPNGGEAKYAFQVVSFDGETGDAKPATHATGHWSVSSAEQPGRLDLPLLRKQCNQAQDISAHYAAAEAAQIALGPAFRWLSELWQTPLGQAPEVLAKLRLPGDVGSIEGHLLHPGLLDACFQVVASAQEHGTMLPFALQRLQFYRKAEGDTWWCHASKTAANKWNIELLNEESVPLAALTGFETRAATANAVLGQTGQSRRDWLYRVTWQPRPVFGGTPSFLPAPAATPRNLRDASGPGLPGDNSEARREVLAELDGLSGEYVLAAFAKAGFVFQPGMYWSTAQIARQVGAIPTYRRLLRRLLGILAEDGVLSRDGDTWQVLQPTPAVDVARISAAGLQSGPPELKLLARCGNRLSEVLRGLQNPLELLFPDGATTDVSDLYVNRAMNCLIEQTMQEIVTRLPSHLGLRVLEIGAGTGSTTEGLLRILPAAQTEYLFTDIGPGFLSKARTRFGEYDFVRYRTLDIEQPPVSQGFARQCADVAVAANVLHATRDLKETLTHVRQLLQPGGQLILLEETVPSRWADLTFGLTDGWWRFADHRQDHPLMAATEWKRLLTENGFSAVETIERNGQAMIVAQASAEFVDKSHETWLIFADTPSEGRASIGEALAKEFERQGAKPIVVHAGQKYRRTGEDTLTIRADQPADYQRALKSISHIHGVVHLWSLNAPEPHADADIVAAAQHSCGTGLTLVQALLREEIKPGGLWLVTRDSQFVTANDAVHGIAQSGLWGIGRVIRAEHPELNCVRVDLGSEGTADSLASALCTQIDNAGDTPREDEIALRRDVRYVARLDRLSPKPGDAPVCRPDATYFVAGGLGGLGVATASWLAAHGAKCLLLIGRSDAKADARQELATLAAQGVSVTVARGDVTNLAALREILANIDPQYPLRGVIHSAGVLDDSALLHQDWERFAKVFAPKAQGAWNLHELTKQIPLDFFVLYSAAAGLLGTRGQASHAAANVFLDALAHLRHAQGLPCLALDWGAWSEIGSAAHLMTQTQSELVQRGLGKIPTDQGLAVLGELLKSAYPQVGAIPIDWDKFLSVHTICPPYFSSLAGQSRRREHPEPEVVQGRKTIRVQLAELEPAEREGRLRVYLQEEAARILYLNESPGLQTGLSELGMDSLLAIEFRRQLEKGLDVSLPSTVAFEYPTLEMLSHFLLDKMFGETEHPALAHRFARTKRVQVEEVEDVDWQTLSDAKLNELLTREIGYLEG